MGNMLGSCHWLVDDGSYEYKNTNGLMIASRKNIVPSRIPLSQLWISDVILENESEYVSAICLKKLHKIDDSKNIQT